MKHFVFFLAILNLSHLSRAEDLHGVRAKDQTKTQDTATERSDSVEAASSEIARPRVRVEGDEHVNVFVSPDSWFLEGTDRKVEEYSHPGLTEKGIVYQDHANTKIHFILDIAPNEKAKASDQIKKLNGFMIRGKAFDQLENLDRDKINKLLRSTDIEWSFNKNSIQYDPKNSAIPEIDPKNVWIRKIGFPTPSRLSDWLVENGYATRRNALKGLKNKADDNVLRLKKLGQDILK